MESTRSGDVLAGRYRLADLLSEARNGRFWKAEDAILGRPVAIHVLAADDERAPALMAAARDSASVTDARLLRVLDAETTGDIAYVVNEWGSGTSLDNVLATDGPLPPRRAAWLTEEVADTLSRAHEAGHAHGRLNPENVLIDDLGAVRIIGFAVEAALHGLEPGRVEDDVVDLGGVLYAGLTGKWAGRTPSRVPAAPTAHGHVLRPRQVRAGVPRVLDDLCGRVVGDSAAPPSAREMVAVLASYVGDATDLGGAPRPVAGAPVPPLAQAAGPKPEDSTRTLGTPDDESATEAVPLGAAAAADAEDTGADTADDTAHDTADDTDRPAQEDASAEKPADEAPSAAPSAPSPADEPERTQPGLPTFDDEDEEWDNWQAPRTEPVPPPPPLEPPAPKPLFADEPRTPRANAPASTTAPEPQGAAPEYWPWSGATPGVDVAEEPEQAPPGRGWIRLAIAVAVAAVLVVCVALAYNATHGGTLLGGDSDESPSAAASSPAAKPVVVRGVTARDFDPMGDPPAEYPDLAHYAVDGDTATEWRTSRYNDQLGPPPGLKTGVGLVLDLQASYAVDSVHLDLVGEPTGVSIYVSDDPPASTPTGKPAATAQVGTSDDVEVSGQPEGRYVLLWFTSLPEVPGGYRLEVAEAKVTGTKAE